MIAVPTLLLLLAANDPADAAVRSAREELDLCAGRIEDLKARRHRGQELDRLLRRAQQLAAELEAASGEAPLRTEAVPPEELRERADAARDEADRLSAEIAALDVKIDDARRSRGEPAPGVARAALGSAAPSGDRVRALLSERALLSGRRAAAEAAAARLDAEARDAERVP